jgi:hypothetical protein
MIRMHTHREPAMSTDSFVGYDTLVRRDVSAKCTGSDCDEHLTEFDQLFGGGSC